MTRKIISAAAVIIFSACLFAGDGFCTEEKMSVMQKIRNAYSDFRSRQQQKKVTPRPEAVKSAAPLVSLPKPEASSPKAEVVKKEMTGPEMLAELKNRLSESDELFDMIPGLKAQTAEGGKINYTFQGVNIDDMPAEDLDNLFTRVGQTLVRIRTDRITRQLEMMNRAQRSQSMAQPRVPSANIPGANAVPRTPPNPPSVPKIPYVPPAPPRNR